MPERPLVLFVATRNNLSGASRSMLDLVRQLRARGVDVTFALHQPGPVNAILDREGIAWTPFRTHRWIGSPRSPLRRLRNAVGDALTARRVGPLARKLGADLVHTNTLSSPVGALIARRAGLPHVWHMREAVDTEEGSVFIGGQARAARFLEGTTLRVFCVSRFLAESTARYAPPERIRTLHNGPLDPAAVARPLLPRPTLDPRGPIRLLTVGFIAERKGQEEAIRALALVRGRGLDARLSLGGEGRARYVEGLKRLAAELGVGDAVEWLGYVDPGPLYAACDLSLLPGRLDPLPRVAIESLGNGIPTVAVRSGGIPEIVDDGETGWLYEPGSEGLADAIGRAVGTSPATREAMRQEGRRRAFERFNMDRYGADAVELYREIGVEPGSVGP